MKKEGVSSKHLFKTVVVAFRKVLFKYFVFKMLIAMFTLANQQFIKYSLTAIKKQKPEAPLKVKLINIGTMLAGLIISDIFLGVFKANTSYLIHLTGYKATNAINSLIYDKALRKSYQRDKLFSLGEITNLT